MIDMALELLTLKEVAQRLRVSKYTVLKFIHNGTLEAVKVGGGYRVRTEALERYILENIKQK